MSCFYFYCKKISGDPRGYVREIGALGEVLEKKKNFYLLSSPHPRKRKKAKSHPVRPATRPAPEARCPARVPALASRRCAARRHLLLPWRPEPSRKPPLEFVLIPRSRGRREAGAPSLGASARAGAPRRRRGPGSFRFLAALQVPAADPRLHPVAAAAPARSLRAHAREMLTHRGARGGRARPSRRLARGARRWPGEMHSEGCPGSRVPWSSLAEHCCRSAAPTVQVHVPEAVGVGQRDPGRPVL